MQKNKIQALTLLAILLVPLLLYTFMRGCSRPVFKAVPKVCDTTWQENKKDFSVKCYELPDFSLQDQEGNRFTKEYTKDNVYVISFFATQLTDSIMRIQRNVMHGNIKEDYYDNAEKIDYVKVLSISTTQDSPEALREYRKLLDVKSPKWTFLTGSKTEVWKIANALNIPEFKGKDTTAAVFAVPTIAFVDKKGQVRSYYTATQLGKEGLYTLKEDLRALIMQEYSNK